MGRNPKPLTIAVVGETLARPGIEYLIDKGHTVILLPVGVVDVVYGRDCWREVPHHDPKKAVAFAKMMEAAVRAKKYPKPPKEGL